MKNLTYIILSFLLCVCTACEGIADILYICNNSDEAIYVYHRCGNVDSIPLSPKLELFHYLSMDVNDAHGNLIEPYFVSPDYRINAYTSSSLKGGLEGRVWGTPKTPRLPCDEKEITLFFITETTMRNHDWEEIYKDQMYVKKVMLTEDDLKKCDWKYIYTP
ncbi:hypothetical protein M2480_003078 [Parabacteroides sp. PFB2-12]|uniref:hypothetical protein n=1 Tax=unclassified Parabacteroides TaxID=2649774 RepID=UPI0024747543|nr:MULTISPECIES: hypothetical protein [unclassified Parabacteroides]MDH6344163.1 hypothetical protein [Parabacteroides sp. PM6-13]MDH6392070.1 hypothetical protein [Parabacteroides sp. PFB2-12]